MAIPGNFHIIRNTSGQTGTGVYDGCLVGDNDSNCTFAENAGYDINGWRNSSSLEAGSQLLPNAPQSFGPVLTRWSGPDKFGPTSSSYSSATWDLSGYNQASDGILYSNRTFIHFKKASTDEFVMIFDEVSRTGAYASMNGYTFYPQGAPTGCCTGGTTTFSSGLLTSTNVANQRIMTRWVAPAGANSLAVINDGAFTNPGNGSASAYRLRHCPSTNGSTCNTSATSMEAIQSHYVTTNANSTFASTLISPDSNWACAQVTGASNTKIGCFARRGSTHSTMTAFTPSYSGTAQILITGLSPGTYNILKNGSTIASGQVVASGDNTIYFEASSGTFSVVQTASPSGSASCDVNGDGVVNVVDVQLVIGAALGAIACTPQFDLNQDGSCTIVDVQRVVNASLGLGCRIGP
jgi:hypothetical protein